VNSSNSYGNTNSNTINQTTAYGTPATPNPSVLGVDSTSATFTWNPVGGISYTYSIAGQSGSASPGIVITGLSASTSYTFTLTATNAGGISASASCNATTLAIPQGSPPAYSFASNTYISLGFGVDTFGNIYVSASAVNKIVKMDSSTGNPTVIVSEGPTMGQPVGSVVYNNILYVCNYNYVSAVDLTNYSNVTHVASWPGRATYIASDGNGYLYATDNRSNGGTGGVWKINVNNNYSKTQINNNGTFGGIAVDRNGIIWIARGEQGGNNIIRMTQAGSFEIVATGFRDPNGICLSPDNTKLYIADGNNNQVKIMNTTTYEVTVFGTYVNTHDVKFDSSGRKLIILHNNFEYSVVDP
jgi:sugar lactone lactonase YvrE